MKKLLIASTALSLAGGAAFAEMAFTLDGDAKMGVDYNSEATGEKSKHEFKHEIGVDFIGSGTTDGGLSFGASAGFDVSDKAINTGTVHVSGSFGTLTIGGNDAADLTAGGTNDVGLFDIGVDDQAEGLRGGTAAQLRYDNTFGQIKIAISAGTTDGMAAVAEMPAVYKDVAVPGFDPTEWYLIDFNNVVHAYDMKPDADTINELFGIARTATSDTDPTLATVTFTPAEGSASPSILNHGYKYDEDGKPETNAEDDPILYDDPGGDDEAEVTDATTVTAFNRYMEVYGLGDDKKVGGGDDVEMVTGDNGVPDRTIVNGVKISEAIPGKDAVNSETQYAFGMSFEAGGVTIGVGYDSMKTISMGAGFTAGEISTNLLYVKTDEEHGEGVMTGIGADMKYTMGASAVTLSYGRRKPEMGEATDAVGMGVTHSLGGDATMSAGFGKVGDSNKASIGLSFNF